ncbi:FadR family transcriptional regulator [Desulfovibrio aminophilus]|nr:FadR/GntR family transcriptional regulator [Desulfovibrio aminophilus]MCM0756155.1 FadR family transcriptional regulator [Desulfovibrio aminophilus]
MALPRKHTQPLGDSLTTPLFQGSVVLLVIDRIKQALINDELKPGDYLPSESELTRNLGVGKSSVREAIKMLQAMGILEVRRGQGTRIREHPSEDALNSMVFQMILAKGITKDMLDLRKMFEPAYTVMAMARATEEDIREIRQALETFEKAVTENRQSSSDDLAFHMAILRATHNPLVIRVGETMMELFDASIETSMRTLPEVALKDHKAIFEAFIEKDEAAVREAIRVSSKSWETSLTYK